MTNFDDPRAVRLRAYELVQGETFLNEEGRFEPVPLCCRISMAADVAKFIATGDLPKGDAPVDETVKRVGATLRAARLEEFGTNWNNDAARNFARDASEAAR